MKLESSGIPTVVVATERFRGLADETAVSLGLPGSRIMSVPHPLGGTDEATVTGWADNAVEEVLRLLTTSGPTAS